MEMKIAKTKIKQILNNNPDCNFETNLIFCQILNISQAQLILKQEISNENFKKILKIAKKRATGRPLQHLLLNWQFYNINLKLTNKVFIPRPETEMLVDFALKLKNKNLNILDLCTGSGCISAAIAKNNPLAKIKAIEFSKNAFKCAKKNIKNFKNQIQLIHGNVLNKNLAKNFENWANLIVCNPPYLNKTDFKNLQTEVKFDPKLALIGGLNGLLFYNKICKLWKKTIKNSGWLIFEIGSNQKIEVEQLLKQNGFINIKTLTDSNKNNRLTVAQKA